MLILLLLCGSFPIEGTRNLDVQDQVLTNLNPYRIRLNEDGSFILCTDHTVRHFAEDGRLIQKFGRNGQGPNEFEYIVSALWDGRFYWVLDGKDLTITQTDGEARFVKAHGHWYNHLHQVGDEFVAVYTKDLRKAMIRRVPKENLPEVLCTIDPYNQFKEGVFFHKVSPKQVAFRNNWQEHYLTKKGDRLFVMFELEKEIYTYDATTKKAKQILSPRLTGFVASPKEMMMFDGDWPKWRRFWYSFSKITGIFAHPAGLAVGYEIPNPEDKESGLVNVALLDVTGLPLGVLQGQDGALIGAVGDKILLLETDEQAQTTQYRLVTRKWAP